MIILNCTQGDADWITARCGKPSSSRFSDIVTTKGQTSKSRQKYLYELAGERIIGTPQESYTNPHMQRGIELESSARDYYRLITGNEVIEVGTCFYDARKLYCASPDGLTEKGCLEIKCPSLPVAVEYLLAGKLPTKYFTQVQGQLFVTEKEYADFLSWYPGLPELLIRVERDEPFIEKLKYELEAFCQELDEVTEKLRNLG